MKLIAQAYIANKDVKSKRIAELNDAFRTTFIGGQVLTTRGVADLPEALYHQVIQKVKSFNTFTEANDPFGEHEMGMFKLEGQSFMWKIDYYDKEDQNYGSSDPSNPNVTSRVLTILLSSEY